MPSLALGIIYVNFTKVIFRPIKYLNLSENGFQRGPQTFIQGCQEIMASRVKVCFIDKSDLVNKGNGFILKDCPGWDKMYQNTP